MKISELRSGQGSVEVEGVISELGDTRAFNKYGRELKVANAILKDDSGAIKLTLWNDDVVRFKEGDRIKIINGYVSEFQGEKQLTSGKFGRMEKVGGDQEKGSDIEVKEEVSKELDDNKAKAKKAIVSKKDIKKKPKEGEVEKTSSLSSDNEGMKAGSLSDNEGQDEFEEKLDEMPEEENLKEEVKEDY